MKFPFELNLALLFRLVLPGSILALATAPLVTSALNAIGVELAFATLFPISALLFGWLIVVSDQPLYMLYEGRRWWPDGLRKKRLSVHRRRLAEIETAVAAEKAAKEAARQAALTGAPIANPNSLATETSLKRRDFPVDKNGARYAPYPTRLGNMLASSEGYSSAAYGADGVFWWHRIWLVMDKDLRAEVDQAQAIADSGLYSSFCIAVASLLTLIYGVIAIPRLTPAVPLIELPYVAGHPILIGGAIVLMCLAYLVYRLHLFSQRQYGELIMALYDHYLPKLDYVTKIAELAKERGSADAPKKADQFRVAARYLRWHEIRKTGAFTNEPPAPWP